MAPALPCFWAYKFCASVAGLVVHAGGAAFADAGGQGFHNDVGGRGGGAGHGAGAGDVVHGAKAHAAFLHGFARFGRHQERLLTCLARR